MVAEDVVVAVLIAAIAIEILNACALVYLVRWSRNAGKSIIGSVRKSLNLWHGQDKPLTEEIRDLVGDVSEKLRGRPAGAAGAVSGPLDVSGIAKQLGVNEGQLRDIAQAYLGGAEDSGADEATIAADPIGRIFTKVMTGGKIGEADWVQAAPMVLAFVRDLLTEKPAQETSGPGTGYW